MTQPLELADIQAPILHRRPAPYWGSAALIAFTGPAGGREFLSQILPHVRSAADEDADKAWISLILTYHGLKTLGVADADLARFPAAFRDGMAARAEKLNDVADSAPSNWAHPWGSGQTSAIVSLVANSERRWHAARAEAVAALEAAPGVRLLDSHDFALSRESRTTFGYRDGISYPHIIGGPRPQLPGEDAVAAGEFVHGYPGEAGTLLPAPPGRLGRNGTYVGVRKIQTDVAAFRRFLRDNSTDENGQELLAAKMVGRWRSGAPLALAPDADDPSLASDPQRSNDFDYADNSRGLVCPLGAHIRRINPRASQLARMSDVNLHRIIRFGAIFGPPLPDGATEDDGQTRGIYFMFMSARAMSTFEFLKSEWLEQGSFLDLGAEGDPIAGRHLDDDAFTIPQRPIRRRLHSVTAFTKTLGGEYGLMPSLSAVRWLSQLPTT